MEWDIYEAAGQFKGEAYECGESFTGAVLVFFSQGMQKVVRIGETNDLAEIKDKIDDAYESWRVDRTDSRRGLRLVWPLQPV